MLRKAKITFTSSNMAIIKGLLCLGDSCFVSKKQLALEEKERDAFITGLHPAIKETLLGCEQNPLVEEGSLSGPKGRDRRGELFLPPVFVKLLIQLKIIEHVTRADQPAYNTRNIFVASDSDELAYKLKNLHLAEGEDAKFIYIDGVHAIPAYARNVGGKIKVFIADSTGNKGHCCSSMIKTINASFDNPEIYCSTTELQNDFYSCSVFSIEAIRYFAKYGDQVFKHIETHKVSEAKDDTMSVKYFDLFAEDLMPNLFKFCQTLIKIPEDALKTKINAKRDETLAQTLQRHQVRGVEDKELKSTVDVNKGAIEERYNFLSFLSEVVGSDDYAKKREELFLNAVAARDMDIVRFFVLNKLVNCALVEKVFLALPITHKDSFERDLFCFLWRRCQIGKSEEQAVKILEKNPEFADLMERYNALKSACKAIEGEGSPQKVILERLPESVFTKDFLDRITFHKKEIDEIEKDYRESLVPIAQHKDAVASVLAPTRVVASF